MARVERAAGGFLDPQSGQIRDKKQLEEVDRAAKNREASSTESESTEEGDTVEREKTVSNALGEVQTRSDAQVNNAITLAKSEQDDIRSAKKLVREQQETLRQLEKANEDGDREKAKELEREFNKREEKKSLLAQQVDERNKERALTGTATIRFGNKEVAEIKPKAIEVRSEKTEIDFNDPESIKVAKQSLREEKASLNEQGRAVKEDLKKIGGAREQIEQDVTKLKENDSTRRSDFVRDFEKAESFAKDIGSQITKAGGQAVLAQNISASSLGLLEG